MSQERLSKRGLILPASVVGVAAAAGALVGPALDRFIVNSDKKVVIEGDSINNELGSATLSEFRAEARQNYAARVALGTCLANPLGNGIWRVTANPGVLLRQNEGESRFVVSNPASKSIDNPRDNYVASVQFSDTSTAAGDTLSGPTIMASRIPRGVIGEPTPVDYVEYVPMSGVKVSGIGLDSTFRRIINGKDTESVPLIHTIDADLGEVPLKQDVVEECLRLGGLTS